MNRKCVNAVRQLTRVLMLDMRAPTVSYTSMDLEYEHRHACSHRGTRKRCFVTELCQATTPLSPCNNKSLKFASSLSPIHHQLAFALYLSINTDLVHVPLTTANENIRPTQI